MSGLSPLKRMTEFKNPKTGARTPIPDETLCWRNNLYTVIVETREEQATFDGAAVLHLSIKRNDRKPIHSWADLQWIKNQLCGPEAEAIELFPAESRMMDAANQYHLWVLPPGRTWPVGVFEPRAVIAPGEYHDGARQEKRQGMGEPTLTAAEAEAQARAAGLVL